MGLRFEQSYPVALGLLAGVAVFLWVPPTFVPSALKELLATIVSISGVGVGFLGTAKSIVLSFRGSRIVKQLKRSEYYDVLIDYLMHGIYLCFLCMIVATIGLLMVEDPPVAPPKWFMALLSGASVAAFLAAFRVVIVLNRFVRSAADD